MEYSEEKHNRYKQTNEDDKKFNHSLKKQKKVIAKNQDMLTVFEELDRTGKFRKINYKTKVSFTIDEELFNKFRHYCKQNGLNMSGRIESYIRKELKVKQFNNEKTLKNKI